MRWETVIRTFAAFVIGPIAPGLLFSVPGVFFDRSNVGLWPVEIAAGFGYPIELILGVPLYLLLRWRRLVGFWVYAVSGMLLGAALYFILLPPVGYEYGELHLRQNAMHAGVLLAMFCGMLASIAFWLIARPDLEVRR